MIFKKTCSSCGKVFATRYEKARFCSKRCIHGYVPRKKKTCQNCGTKFVTKYKKARFCCKKCMYDAQKRAAKTCPVCQLVHRKPGKYCSKDCANISIQTAKRFRLMLGKPNYNKRRLKVCYIRTIPSECIYCGRLHLKKGKCCSDYCSGRMKSKGVVEYLNTHEGLFLRAQRRKFMIAWNKNLVFRYPKQEDYEINIPVYDSDILENYLTDFS